MRCGSEGIGPRRGEAPREALNAGLDSSLSVWLERNAPRWRAAWLAWRKLRRADRSQRQAQHETARMQRERTQRELQALRDQELREWHHRFIGTDSGLQRFKDFWQG